MVVVYILVGDYIGFVLELCIIIYEKLMDKYVNVGSSIKLVRMDNIVKLIGSEVFEVEVVFVVYCSDVEFKLVYFMFEFGELDLKVEYENEILVVSFFVSFNLVVSNLLFLCVRIVVWRKKIDLGIGVLVEVG